MPTDTPPNPPRKGLEWGRPPQPTFRAGPLPAAVNRLGAAPLPARKSRPVASAEPPASARVAEQLSMPMPEAPPTPTRAQPKADPAGLVAKPARAPTARPGGGIFSGSLVPQAARPASAPTPAATPAPATPAAPEPAPAPRPAPVADAVLRPLPEASRPVAPVAASDLVVPTTRPAPAVAAPSAVVRPSTGPRRWPLYAGAALAVLAVGAGVVWMLTRPEPPVPTVETTAPVSTPVFETPTASSTAPVETPSEVTVPVAPTASVSAPETDVPARAPTAPLSRPTTQPAAPVTTAAPPPVVILAPPPVAEPDPAPVEVPVGPPPTAARPQANDPDAPIVTRPQPLN